MYYMFFCFLFLSRNKYANKDLKIIFYKTSQIENTNCFYFRFLRLQDFFKSQVYFTLVSHTFTLIYILSIQDFLKKLIVAFKELLTIDTFPKDWFVLRTVGNK